MPRYIDADKLMKYIRQRAYLTDNIVERPIYAMTVLGIQQTVDEQPTVSPDDVRGVGMWRSKTMTVPGGHGQTYNRWGCSKCKAKFKTRTNYCPSCGVRMKGE